VIRLSKHAQEALDERKIAFDWVQRTLAAPDYSTVDPNDASLIRSFKAIDEAGGRVLRVVRRPDGTDILVVTVHFDRGARR